ncbi:hypothetical protein AGMMS49928_14900 [Spirochaetia bacterium]|nr:hypothetical protein AGMMS49928_14900 [Spirochaetia bacterium]
MFDIKISGAVAAIAFILSLILGVASGAALGVIFLRAIIFALVFFVIVSGAYILISRFMPEFFDGSGGSAAGKATGTRVNITLDDGDDIAGQNAAVPDGGLESSGGDELGDISSITGDSSSGEAFTGLDQKAQDGYTVKGVAEESPFGEDLVPPPVGASPAAGASSPSEDDFGEAADEALPDLTALAGAFSGLDEDAGNVPSEQSPARPFSTSGKPQKFEGDFNPKELAEAIRTTLKKDKG